MAVVVMVRLLVQELCSCDGTLKTFTGTSDHRNSCTYASVC
jgi:hypothetical protein